MWKNEKSSWVTKAVYKFLVGCPFMKLLFYFILG